LVCEVVRSSNPGNSCTNDEHVEAFRVVH
jgi:hypothetical protein